MLSTVFSITPIESCIELFGLTHLSVLIISLINDNEIYFQQKNNNKY